MRFAHWMVWSACAVVYLLLGLFMPTPKMSFGMGAGQASSQPAYLAGMSAQLPGK